MRRVADQERNERPPLLKRAERQRKDVGADDLSEAKIGVEDQHRAAPCMREVRARIDASAVELLPVGGKPRESMSTYASDIGEQEAPRSRKRRILLETRAVEDGCDPCLQRG